MSEYQYYEFQALDRPLTKAEMAELRALSTRATIIPTRLQNEYHWGDFKGDPLTLMERYFDAHVYFANWGTRRLMLRFPRHVLDPDLLLRYCCSDWAEVYTRGEQVILDLRSEDEEGDEDWEEGDDAWTGSLIPIRAELTNGDLRPLYLSWLACAGAGILDDGDSEPPVPDGLGDLSASQRALANFLRIGDDLLAVAAGRSAPRRETRAVAGELARWVATLPTTEKDALLVRLLAGDAPHLRAELLRRFERARAATSPTTGADTPSMRIVGELVAAAAARGATRRREQVRREADERDRQQQRAAATRAAFLDNLATRQEAAWHQVEALVEFKRAKEYDQATQLLVDLRDVAARTGTTDAFRERLRQVRLRHTKKPSFLERLDRTGMRA